MLMTEYNIDRALEIYDEEHRIELAAKDAELSAKNAELSAKDEEIARLKAALEEAKSN